jgi:hypothetical protein
MFLGSTYFKYVFVFIVLSYFVRIIYDVHVLQLLARNGAAARRALKEEAS